MRIKLLLIVILFLGTSSLWGQVSSLRTRTIPVSKDTLLLDSLTIYPPSFKVLCGNKKLSKSVYFFNAFDRTFYTNYVCSDSMVISYRVFQTNLEKPVQTIDTSLIYREQGEMRDYYYPILPEVDDVFSSGNVMKSGSISRGIVFGNNQDLSVNSTLNLQLSGKITDNMRILATLTDDNLPIQPDGNTNQLQDFDRVFIKLYGTNYNIIAGDFWLQKPTGYFMNYNKRVQGLTGEYTWGEEGSMWDAKVSGALSKGKFSRAIIQGQEGNQGPYKLEGNENEPYIMVLAGTEKVYLDGKLLKRGQQFDYTIDYNTAEILFTPRNHITKDARIIVEFQYTDQNYVRFLVQAGIAYKSDKFDFWLNVYNEQDAKNQSIQQQLDNQDKALLSQIGDSIQLARTNSIDSVGFLTNQVTYKMIDSVGIDSVLVYSVNQDSAVYTAQFTEVGQGNGNYIFDRFIAVGRVYKWVQPIGGQPQGNYAPTKIIVTPKKQLLITAGMNYKFNSHWDVTTELSTSNHDRNMFSRIGNKDNRGFANRTTITGNFDIGRDSMWIFTTALNVEYLTPQFQPIEHYRSVEFNRDWNVRGANYFGDQLLANLSGKITHKNFGGVKLVAQNYTFGNDYQGNRAKIDGSWSQNGFDASINGSYLRNFGEQKNTYLRHIAKVSQDMGPIKVGFEDNHELNRFHSGDSLLLPNSYQWYDWKVFLGNSDSSRNKFEVFYSERYDWLSDSTHLKRTAIARTIGGSYNWITNEHSQLTTMVSYRKLAIKDDQLSAQQPENTFLGRINYHLNILERALTLSTFYEVGSGLERKKEFLYIEVAAGKGVYTWNDYNGDGIKDLNEFEIAQYQDEAKYIRIYTPSNDYVRTYSNEFNQTLFWRPERLWENKSGFLKFISRFSNQTQFRIHKKTADQTVNTYNPLTRSIADSSLISLNSTIQNTFFFNRISPIIGANYTFSEAEVKQLLANGFLANHNMYHKLEVRWNITRNFTFRLKGEVGDNESLADYTDGRNFIIQYKKVEPEFIYQPSSVFRLALNGRYEEKNNAKIYGGQEAFISDIGMEMRWNQIQKGSLLATFRFISIHYTGLQNTALTYQMLEALQPGKNFTWSINYQMNISKHLQLNIHYNGRKSEGNKTIHAGGISVRAFF